METNEKTIVDGFWEDFGAGKIDKRVLEGRIFTHVLENRIHYGWRKSERDECADFLAWLYPRLSTAIDRYTPRAPFGGFIAALVRYAKMEYRSLAAGHARMEESVWNDALRESVAAAEHEEEEEISREEKVTNPRQLLMVLLKSYYHVDENMVRRLAPNLGLNEEEAVRLFDDMRRLRLRQDDEVRRLREKIHEVYYRCIVTEKDLQSPFLDEQRREQLEMLYEKRKRRLAALRRRLRETNIAATHREIASVLGVKKGNVDRLMYSFNYYAAVGKKKAGRRAADSSALPSHCVAEKQSEYQP